MPKWKCDICGTEFDNFQAQGFDNKIYCPLCFYKHEFNNLNKGIDELIEKYQDKLQSLTWIKTISLEANEHNQNSNIKKEFYEIIIQDLEKLKGE